MTGRQLLLSLSVAAAFSAAPAGLVVVAFGAGVNSTALLAGMYERGMRPDLILFADTGGERAKTYRNVRIVSDWCIAHGFPPIITVRKGGRQETLEENCLRMGMLPSIAYGHKGCSHKFKREPQDVYVNNWAPARESWKAGQKVTKLIGYDAGEPHRARITSDDKYEYRYLLIEWDWGREECEAACRRHGLPFDPSACFFCPSSTRDEIDALHREEPILFYRAIRMEVNAEPNLDTVAGLGRRFSWHEHLDTDEAREFAARGKARYEVGRAAAKEAKRVESGIERDCGCYDGQYELDAPAQEAFA